MKRRYKAIMLTLIFSLAAGTHLNVPSFYATEQNNNSSSTNKYEVKTTINDLLNVDKYLFLEPEKPYIDSAATYMINADTGQVLYDDGYAEASLPILSVSKTLSAYVILDEMKKSPDKYNWDTKITAEGNIVLLSYETKFSNLSLYEGSEYTLRELFEGMMIKSSNSATMLIGKYMFGDEKSFVEAIRKKVKDLGLRNTTIYTSTGLSTDDLAEYDYHDLEHGENKMSAEDVAFLTKRITQEYPEVLEITAKPSSVFATLTDAPFEYTATNWLLPGFEYGYEGVTGLKTGADLAEYTSNIVFTANKNGINVIGVILGARDSDVRSEEAIKLLDYAYNSLEHKIFISPTSKLFGDGTVKVKYAAKHKVAVKAKDNLTLATSFKDLEPTYIFVPTNSKYDEKYDAFVGEIKKGEVLGYITVQFSDLSFLTDTNQKHYSVEVVADEDISKGFFIFHGFEWLADKIKGLFS